MPNNNQQLKIQPIPHLMLLCDFILVYDPKSYEIKYIINKNKLNK